jgi:hypothetical protein
MISTLQIHLGKPGRAPKTGRTLPSITIHSQEGDVLGYLLRLIAMFISVPFLMYKPILKRHLRHTRPCQDLPNGKVFLAHNYPNLGQNHRPPIEIGGRVC